MILEIIGEKKISRKNNHKILEHNRLKPSSDIEVVVNTDSKLESPKDSYYNNDEVEIVNPRRVR